jgi:hypothetical protein
VLVKQSYTEVDGRGSNKAAAEDRKRKKTEGEELRTIDSNIIHPL